MYAAHRRQKSVWGKFLVSKRRIGMLYPGGKMQVYSRTGHGTVVRFELPQTQQLEEKEGTLS